MTCFLSYHIHEIFRVDPGVIAFIPAHPSLCRVSIITQNSFTAEESNSLRSFKHDKKKTHFYKFFSFFFFFCNSKINNIICDWKLFSGIIVYLKQCKNALKKLNLNYSFFWVYLALIQRALSSCIARAIVKLMSFSPISVI